MAKTRRPIATEDIPGIFNDECIRGLEGIGKLPKGANLARFSEGVRVAARIYASETRRPTNNELHAEIEKLWRAADRKRSEQVADLIENLSPEARRLLNARKTLLSIGKALPSPETLRDPKKGEAECTLVATLCQHGGMNIEGRRRSSGKRSRPVWRPVLHAPKRQQRFPKRDAERNLVMWLQVAWLDATGDRPEGMTAHHDKQGPFVKLARRCLELVGAPQADPVELINELHRPPSTKRQHRELKRQRTAKARKSGVSSHKP